MGMMINRRRAYGGKSLPYDAEIEYLESTGTQYINTGITNITNSRFELVVSLTAVTANYYGILLGARKDTTYNNSMKVIFGYTDVGNFYSQSGNDANGYIISTHADYNKHTLELITTNNNQTLKVDGNSLSQSFSTTSEDNFPLFLCARNNYGVAGNFVQQRVYLLKIYSNNTLIIDLIPVRKGNVGYLYDKVSGQLFGNDGTGDFILGSDK